MFTPDQLQQISQQYLAEHTPSDLARRWHCTIPDIEAALDATGTPRRKRGGGRAMSGRPRAVAREMIAERTARIIALHAEGKTTVEIMAEVRLGRAAVCAVLRGAGLARQPVSDAAIITAHRAGATLAAIVKDLHVSYHRARSVLAAAGLLTMTPGRHPDIAERNAEILRRRRAGESPNAIAEAMGVKASLVYKVLSKVDDLPPRRKAAPTPAARAAPRANPDHPRPVLLDRPVVPIPAPKTHITFRRPQKQAEDTEYRIVQLPPAPSPQRPPDPPCEICGASPCPMPLTHGRLARARRQHHYQPRPR